MNTFRELFIISESKDDAYRILLDGDVWIDDIKKSELDKFKKSATKKYPKEKMEIQSYSKKDNHSDRKFTTVSEGFEHYV